MTRIAVLSDVHGNCVALNAVLDEVRRERVDQFVCLGDMIQGGPQPAQVVARLRELACPVVMGNSDAWLLSGAETDAAHPASPHQMAVREWSLSLLSQDDREFIAAFQPTVEIALEGETRLLGFHGSPLSFDDVILPETPEQEFQSLLGAFQPAVLCGGHTHLQQIRRLGDSFFFNPGSVGFAYNRNPPIENFHADAWAEYAVLTADDERLRLEFRRVPFGSTELIRAYAMSGRPHADDAIAQYQS